MKYLPLVWSNLWRNPVRTVLTFLSIVAAFVLLGLLQGVNAGFSQAIGKSNAGRLLVVDRVSFTELLPLAYMETIRSVPGVKQVAFATYFGGYYQQPTNQMTTWMVDSDHFFDVYPEYRPSAAAQDAFKSTADGAIAGSAMAKKYGWKIGDRIPLRSTLWMNKSSGLNWNFRLVGIYPSDKPNGLFAANHRYFDKARAFGEGSVGWYIVQIADPSRSAAIAESIDRRFANSPDETKTITEKEFIQSFIRQIGDLGFVIAAVTGAVLFTLFFLTWNTISQSVRERIADFAVLKTLGFSNLGVAGLIVSEALAIYLAGAAVGLALAALAYGQLPNIFAVKALPAAVIAEGVAVAVVLSLLSVLFPGVRIARLGIVDALSRRP